MVLALSDVVAVRLSVARVRRVLLVIVLVLLVLDEAVLTSRYFLGHGRLGGLYALFDLDVETSVSTFVQSTLLVTAAVVLWLLARALPDARLVARVLAAATLWVAADEASQIHELLIVPIDRAWHTSGIFRFGWVIPGIAVAVVVVVLSIRLVRAIAPSARPGLVVGGALYLLGAVGMEMAGGAWLDAHGGDAAYRMVFTSIEETMEGAGIVLALAALLEALRAAGGVVRIGLEP